MLLSEFIAQAQKLLAENGDAEVKTSEFDSQWDKSFTCEFYGITPYYSYLRDENDNLVKDAESKDKFKRIITGVRYYKV